MPLQDITCCIDKKIHKVLPLTVFLLWINLWKKIQTLEWPVTFKSRSNGIKLHGVDVPYKAYPSDFFHELYSKKREEKE